MGEPTRINTINFVLLTNCCQGTGGGGKHFIPGMFSKFEISVEKL